MISIIVFHQKCGKRLLLKVENEIKTFRDLSFMSKPIECCPQCHEKLSAENAILVDPLKSSGDILKNV